MESRLALDGSGQYRETLRFQLILHSRHNRRSRITLCGVRTPGPGSRRATTAEPVHAPEAAHYTDPARFEREQDRIYRRTRQHAGYVSAGRGVGSIHDQPEAAAPNRSAPQ